MQYSSKKRKTVLYISNIYLNLKNVNEEQELDSLIFARRVTETNLHIA